MVSFRGVFTPVSTMKLQYPKYVGDLYSDMVEYGISKEDARYLLPNACCTDLYLSCNLRELIHIANERLCKKAQWEIRELVTQMVALVDDDLKPMLVSKCESGLIICRRCNNCNI